MGKLFRKMNTIEQTGDIRRINRFNIVAAGIFLTVIYAVSGGSLLIGKSQLWYFLGFVLVTMLGFGSAAVCFCRNQDDQRLKYFLSAAYVSAYLYIMILGSADFRFALIFPPLCVMIMYHSAGFMLGLSMAAIAVNVMNVCVCIFVFGRTDFESCSRYVLQLVSVMLATLGAVAAARMYSFSFKKTESQNHQLQQMTLQTIETIANTIDAKDSYTQGHSRRVAEYSVKIAEHMGCSAQECSLIRYIALLHDVGKIAVPDTVLNKPSRLTAQEYDLMKQHTTAGGEILKEIQTIPDIALGAKYHHERYDGKGYPEGLAGEQIPRVARIICLADAYDAMTSNRVYRKHLPIDVVIEEMHRCRGTQFDPACVDAFLEYLDEAVQAAAAEEADARGAMQAPVAGTLRENAPEARQPVQTDLDELTGAMARIAGEQRLRDLLETGQGALLLVNIVGLKEINLEYGFRRGDHYLKIVAEVLRDTPEDITLVRYGGNEFVVYLPGLNERAAVSEWMERFLERMSIAERNDSLIESRLGVSCAITLHHSAAEPLSAHLRELDRAIYHLKRGGDNEYAFYDAVSKEGDEFLRHRDMQDLVDAVGNSIRQNGADLMVEIMGEKDFVRTLAQLRDEQTVTLLLLTVKPTQGDNMPLESRQNVMELLEDAIVQTVGSRRYLSSYSSLQRIVMLPAGEDEGNVDRVEKAILTGFYRMHDKNDVEISCSHCTIDRNGEPVE